MKRTGCLLALALCLCSASDALAIGRGKNLCALNRRLHGQVVDHTANHGADRRIWSPALGERRDLYIYLPPSFDPRARYPLLLWFHGIVFDEWYFVENVIPIIDDLMARGKLPPMIIALPDGMVRGRGGYLSTHTGYLNSRLGRFEDYVMCDVWNFVVTHYPIRPERDAHVLAGVSMGGGAAYHHAIKHRDRFGVVFGIFPPLNVRWLDCHGRYFANFDPECWGWRESVFCGIEPIGKFYGVFRIPVRRLVYPLYGRGPAAVEMLSRNNPIEMLDYHDVRPGELSMFVAYGGRDEFNLDAQVESFLYRAHQRGLKVDVCYDPRGRHNEATALRFLQPVTDWLAPQLAPYSPPVVPSPQHGRNESGQ